MMTAHRVHSESTSPPDCSLYVHVPFCIRKCRYCAFYSIPAGVEKQQHYLSAVQQELALYGTEGSSFRTVFLGGGSPSAMEETLLLELVRWAGKHLQTDAEFTVEVNPGQTSRRLFERLRECRVNRISIGAQSFWDTELEFLGRIHTSADIIRCAEDARSAGFENIGLDLIFAIPGSTRESWKHNLNEAVRLQPVHISAYSLTYESDTPLVQSLRAGQIKVLDEETDRAMYELTLDALESAGFAQYEISNFAKPGFECRHNLRYWQNKPYLGLGPAAAGWYHGRRTENVADADRYLQSIDDGHFAYETEETLSPEDIACETAVLNLRTRAGIEPIEFHRQTGYDVNMLFAESITRYLKEGLLEWRNNKLRLTRRALPIADRILCDFAAADE